jgi:hypothetical protein
LKRALAFAVIAFAATPAAGKGKKRGKVVRVERNRVGPGHTLRMCSNPSAGQWNCYGLIPSVEEVGTVVDETGVRGTVSITSVTPQQDNCGNPIAWTVATTQLTGDVSNVSYNGALMLDFETSPRARVILNTPVPAPSGRSNETMMIELDNDGDDVPEVLESFYPCDDMNNQVVWANGQQGNYCLVYYQRKGAYYDEARVDRVRNCNY